MKKIVTFFALALLASVMVSCNNENSPMAQDEKVAVQFTGDINVSTRAAGVAWADGDKIGIFMTAAKETLSANSIKEGVTMWLTRQTEVFLSHRFQVVRPFTTPLMETWISMLTIHKLQSMTTRWHSM